MFSIKNNSVHLRLLTTCRILINRSYVLHTKGMNFLDIVKTMPREAQVNRETNDLNLSNKVNDVRVVVMGSGAHGAPTSVMIKTPVKSYIINCGEGCQRLFDEYRLKLSKAQQLFITFPSWKNVSGILGTSLTLQSSGGTEFSIHGHSCIGNIFSCVNKFVNLKSLQVKVFKCSHYDEFTDGIVLVKYVLLYPSSSENGKKNLPEATTVELEGNENTESEGEVFNKANGSSLSDGENEEVALKKRKKKKAKHDKESVTEDKSSKVVPANCFIFTTEKTAGTLLIEKCMEFGVPPGPLLGELKQGRDVTLPNGNVVRSEDVKTDDLPGVRLIAVECPSEEYLDSLLNEPLFHKYQSGDDVAEAVIHFSSPKIVKNPKYQHWIKLFPQETKHLFINEDNNLSGSVAILRQQFKLNLLGTNFFPQLHSDIPIYPRKDNCITHDGHSLVPGSSKKNDQIYSDILYYKCESNNFIKGETLCTLYLKPKLQYDYSNCLALKKHEFLREVYESDKKVELEKYREKIQELCSKLSSNGKVYPKVVFLGTGSSKPSKIRNASGILIFTEENKCILFDCGECTFNQLMLIYGKEKCREILRNLEAIFISHLHIDHHFGLVTILKERFLAFDGVHETESEDSSSQLNKTSKVNSAFKPVFLLAPLQLLRWLQLFSEDFEDISNLYELIGNSLLDHDSTVIKDMVETCKTLLNLKRISVVPVCHAPNSYGISVIHKNGWKITYSGDTRPCEDLVKLGMNSDILIHEATFEDIYRSQAKYKLHSTTSEAIDVGRRMKAKYILLTHFSQRYSYLPNITEKLSQLNVGIAFDLMEIPYNMLPVLPLLLTPLQYIFSEQDERNKTNVMMLKTKREREYNKYAFCDRRSPAEDVKPAKISRNAFKN